MAEQTDQQLKIHGEAMKHFTDVEDINQRKLSIDEMLFAHVEGEQWDEDASKKRINRPRFTINRVEPAIDQIVGDQRQNRTSIKVRPVSGGADEKTAKIYSGLIRNIESLSKATNSYDAAFDEAVAGGFGGWRVLTEFNDDDIFEQDIKIDPINSAASSLYFGPSKKYDKRDAPWAFVVTNMTEHEFVDKWPEAQIAGFDQTDLLIRHKNCRQWFEKDKIRVAEYWIKEPIKKEIGLLSDGKVIDLDEDGAALDELEEQGITVLKRRKVDSHKIFMYKMSGAEVLEPRQEWAGKFIPLIPVFGKVHNIDGRTYVKGIVRNAKDPQRIYNYETSQSVETSSLTPKDPYWYTPKMAAGHESKWATFNTRNDPFMPFNIDEQMPGPPTRTGSPSLQQASMAMIAQASGDIHATTGMFPPAMGNAPQLLSEKSVQNQAEKGDRGSFVFDDNLQKSIEYTAEILIDLIPRIYDTARTIRVLNVDSTSEQVDINQGINQTILDDESGDQVIVNDLTQGKYDIATTTGPSFATKRQESVAQLTELAAANPNIAPLILDIIARNLDINDSDELHDRLRKQMIQAGTVEPTEEEIEELGLNQPQEPDPTQVALLENVQMSTQQLMADIENTEADTANKKVTMQQNSVKTLDLLVNQTLEKLKAGQAITNDEVQILITQRDIVADGQDVLERELLLNSPQLLNQQPQ